MADGKVVIQIDADASDFNRELTNIKVSANDLGNKALKGMAVGVAAVTTALASGAAAATAAGSAYELAFAKTQTIMDTNVVSAQQMSGAIIRLSNDTGTAATKLSGSVYDAISATSDTAGAVKLAADASKLATAGFAEEGDALSILTTITNAYGMKTSEAQAVSDSLIQTQNLGVTTVGALATSMGKAIATAAAYSIDLYNLESGYISLTKAGISTEESTTYLSSLFKELGDSGSTVAKILQEKTGKSFGTLMKEGYSLGDVLAILQDHVHGDSEALINLWSSAEAGKASAAIASQGVKTFNENLSALRNSAGTTEKAYSTMASTLSFQTERLQTRVVNLGTAIYDHFDEALTAGVSTLSDAFLELSDSVTDGALSGTMDEIGAALEDLITSGAEFVSDVLPGILSGAAWVLDNGSTIAILIGGATAAVVAYKGATLAATIAQNGLNLAMIANPYGLAAAALVGLTAGMIALFDAAGKLNTEQQAAVDGANKAAEAAGALAEQINNTRDAYAGLQSETTNNRDSADHLITSLVQLVAGYDGTAASAYAVQEIISQLNELVPGLNLEFDEQTGALSQSEAAMRALNDQYSAQEKYDAALKRRTELQQEHEDAISAVEEAQNAYDAALIEVNKAQENYNECSGLSLTKTWKYSKALTETEDALHAASDALALAKSKVTDTGVSMREAENDCNAYGQELNAATEAASQFADETDTATDAVDEAAAAAAEATQAIWGIASAAVDARYSGDDLRQSYNDLKDQLDEVKESGDETAVMWAEQKLHALDVAATAQELTGSYQGYVDAAAGWGVGIGQLSGYLIENGLTAEEWGSQVGTAVDGVVNDFSLLDTSLDMSLSEMASNLQSNITAHQNWESNLQTLMDAAVQTGNQSAIDFVLYMQNMGIGAADQVQAMVDDVDGTMDTFPQLFADAAAQGVLEVSTGIENGKATVTGATQTMMDDTTAIVEGTDFTAPAVAGVEDMAAGITAQAGSVETAATTLSTAVTTAWTQSSSKFQQAGSTAGTRLKIGLLQQQSPIRTAGQTLANAVLQAWTSLQSKFQQAGTAAARALSQGISAQSGTVSATAYSVGYGASTSLASGIGSGRGSIYSAASSAASSAISGFQSVGGWYSIGYYIAQGVANGIYGGSYLIRSAAVSAAQSAYQAAASKLRINSPSKLFRDKIGMSISEGMAVGIRKGTPMAVDSVELTAEQLLRATRVALRPGGDTPVQQYISNTSSTYQRITGGRDMTISVPVILNDREIARATTKSTGRRMAYLEGFA